MLKKFMFVFVGGLSISALVACGGGGSSTSSSSSSSGGSGGGKVSCASTSPHQCIEYTLSGSNSSYSGTAVAYFYDGIESAEAGAGVCSLLNNVTVPNSSGSTNVIASPCGANEVQGTACVTAGNFGYCSFSLAGNASSSTISNAVWHNM